MHRLYASMTLFYNIRVLSICGFWYPWDGSPETSPLWIPRDDYIQLTLEQCRVRVPEH